MKERIHELEDIVQSPLDISSSLMDELGRIPIVGIPSKLLSAGVDDHLWDVLSQTSNIDSRIAELRFGMQEHDCLLSSLDVMPGVSEVRCNFRIFYDILEAGRPFYRGQCGDKQRR